MLHTHHVTLYTKHGYIGHITCLARVTFVAGVMRMVVTMVTGLGSFTLIL